MSLTDLTSIGLAVILGSCAGSFSMASALRMLLSEPVLMPRSRCRNCNRPLNWRDLLPVLSWCHNAGRARCCGVRISAIYSLAELASAWLAAGLVILTSPLTAFCLFIYIHCIVIIFITDMFRRIIYLPVLVVMGLAAMGGIAEPHLQSLQVMLSAGITGICWIWGAETGYRIIRKQQGMGTADKWLAGAIGVWTGSEQLIFIILCACLIGFIHSGYLAAKHNFSTKTRLPFGSYLCAASLPFVLLQFL